MTPANYVCLLRGINVGGHKLIKMDRLRAGFEKLGFENVKTYIQSGNVVFRAPDSFKGSLSQKIGDMIFRDFGFSVSVLVLTAKEVETTVRKNPFLLEKDIDPATLHVTFLSEAPQTDALEKLTALASKPDRFYSTGKVLYLHIPKGYGNTKLANPALEKILSVSATTRNWKTVNELSRIVSE